MSQKRVTIADIAAKSGFSKTAVSFAFNKPDRVSAEARKKILAVAAEEGYIPDPMARNFTLGNHMNVGFLLPQKVEYCLANPYMHGIIRGIAEVCQSKGYMFTVIPPLRSSIDDAVRNATVDGIITMGLTVSESIGMILRHRQMPVVAIDGADNTDVVSVNIDDTEAARLQMKMALDRGHRRIAVLSLQDDYYAADTPGESLSIVRKRKLGFSRALEEYGMSFGDIICINAETTFDAGFSSAQGLLSGDAESRPTCFVCMSDIAALGVMSAIREMGLEIPQDVSVIGFDGLLEDLSYYGRRLTTIRQSAYEKGIASARCLFSIMEGNPGDGEPVRIPFSIVEGSTLGDAP